MEKKVVIQSSIKGKTKGEVITGDGTSAPRDQCRLINEVYYKVGDVKKKNSGQCYIIGNTAYRATNTNITWDYEKEEYCLIRDREMIKGVAEFVNGQPVIGLYSPNLTKNCKVSINGEIIPAFSAHILPKAYNYSPLDGLYSSNSRWTRVDRRNVMGGGARKVQYTKFPDNIYNAADHPMANVLEKTYQENLDKLPASKLDKFFRGYTLGAEIETSAGSVPEHELYRLGLMPLLDGSITGHEYTTVVIRDKWFNSMLRVFEATQSGCTTNEQCSLHYHIGGAPTSPEYVVSLWSLYYRIQNELDQLMPPYKRSLQYLTNKRDRRNQVQPPKDHCKQIPALGCDDGNDVNQIFESILLFLNEGEVPRKNGRTYIHRKQGRNKWEMDSRYYALNLLPLLFENKHTIEFRLHGGTTNATKGMAWLMICLAITKYAEANIQKILERKEKITLSDVIENTYNDNTPEGQYLVSWLLAYIKHRRNNYAKLYITNDIFGNEFTDDDVFQFNLDGKSLINFG